MKTLIVAIAALLLSAHAFAADECVEVGQMYYSAAAQRDKAVSQDEVARNIHKNFASLSKQYNLDLVVTAAFKHFDISPEMLQGLASAKCQDDHAQTIESNPAAAAAESTRQSVALPAAPVVASGYSHTFDVCMSKSNGVTVEMLDCTAAETSKQDNALNQNYHLAMATLPPDRRLELRNTQRAWIKDRDSKCVLDQAGGTAAQINSASCVLDMTAQRAKELIGMQPR